MNYSLKELLDVAKLQELLDSLDEVHSLPSAIIDTEGSILTATAWQDICTKFHRMNPNTEKKCIESDLHIGNRLTQSMSHVIYRCPMGLVDTASPIIIEGRHLGNVFSGQLFMEAPDESYFKEQARLYGFDETEYLVAMRKVPILSREHLNRNLAFIVKLAQMLAEQGLQAIRQQEVLQKLKKSEEFTRSIIASSIDCIKVLDCEGRILSLSEGGQKLLEIDELRPYLGLSWIDFWKENSDEARLVVEKAAQGEVGIFNGYCPTAKGTPKWWEVIVSPIRDADGSVEKLLAVSRDITLIRQAENALRNSERTLSEAQRIAHIGSWELDLVNNTLEWSDEIYRIFEIDPEQFSPSYDSFLASIHPDDRDAVNDAYTRSLETKEPYEISHRLLMPDGRIKYVQEQCETSYSPEGKPIRSIGIVKDVTERTLSDKILAESQTLLHGIIDSTSDFIWSVDPVTFGVCSYNQGISEYFFNRRGIHLEKGMRPEDLFPPGEFVQLWHDLYNRALDEGYYTTEYSVYDGTIILELSFNLLKNDNKVFGISVFGKNITQSKRANQILTQTLKITTLLAELSTEFLNVATLELDQKIAEAQRNICELLNFDISSIFQPLPMGAQGFKLNYLYRNHDGPSPPDVFLLRESFPWCEQQVLSGKTIIVNSMETLPAEATRDKESWSRYGIKSSLIFPLIDKGSKILGTISFAMVREELIWVEELVKPLQLAAQLFANALARKNSEEEKFQLESQLHQAQKMESIGSLAGGVAHDFNNKLTVILGYSQLAESEQNPAILHEYFEGVINAAEQSADLTRQLLAFARKQTIEPKVLDLNETISGMLKMLQRLIGEDINLNWHPAPNLWEVKLDPSQVDQVLANLCVNARDAITNGGTISIETGINVIDEEYCTQNAGFTPGEYVRLSVSDTGCGMEKETLAQIFEPFFTTKSIGEGTGLGLATVYGIVKQNNGCINVYSEPSIGTTFAIYLPRYAGDAGQTRKKEVIEPAKRGKETILLVEDEPAILKITTIILSKQGYTVLAANSPSEAIRLANDYTNEINLLMTDVVMPEMNGRDLAIKLQTLYPQLKCLYMSGYTADVIAHHGVLDEGLYFIQKPYSVNTLADKLRDVLDNNK